MSGFRDLESVMIPSVAQAMSRVYRDVEDIDLFIGGVSEWHVKGALVGPTFACIIAEQFRRLKKGDRFWFENSGLESSFTDDQLREIRKSSLARVLCDNSNVRLMQPLAMVQIYQWFALILIQIHVMIEIKILCLKTKFSSNCFKFKSSNF